MSDDGRSGSKLHIKERNEDMSDKEKKILETITNAIPAMSDFEKGYLLGMGEAISNSKKDVYALEGDKNAGIQA